jgi:hypothetical protein
VLAAAVVGALLPDAAVVGAALDAAVVGAALDAAVVGAALDDGTAAVVLVEPVVDPLSPPQDTLTIASAASTTPPTVARTVLIVRHAMSC